ncbi:MAG: chromosome segregation protein SMC [Oscillospiraceae bacterium]|nr:chromosome segregation protein SMC [Oscillospiraceae bacterium]
MYLKSLELQGFKSFPDKVKLTFDQGLTGVVGPNGSGKSNIGDAVRWVLGEQSTKTLRGSKMEDVIFSGTTARKAVGFASVTLVIDNSSGELQDNDKEVAVTRKLYRSGESEYRINGRSVRLKDINELFMDTGLGRDGYSIIGQGRIAEIVSAKSTDRRDIFEEAAGISKFRYKKSEAERKLVQAQENINRLQDIVSELESRVGPLREQSEKAQKFVSLAGERKTLEVSLWVHKLTELSGVINKFAEDALIFAAQYEDTENKAALQEEKIRQCYQKMRESTVRTDEVQSLIIEAEKKSSEYKAGIAVLSNEIMHHEELISTVNEKQSQNENSKKTICLKIEELKLKLAQTKKLYSDIQQELDKAQDSSRLLDEQSRSIEKSFDEKGDTVNMLYMHQSEEKLAIASAETSISESQHQLDESLAALAEVNEKILHNKSEKDETLSAIKEADKMTQENENRLAGLDAVYRKRKESFDENKTLIEKTILSIKEKEQRQKLLTDLENSMEGFNYSVKEVIKASKSSRISGILGTVAQIISVDTRYALAIETALGGALQNIIVENEETAKRCISLLKEMKKGRATFLPLTSVKAQEFYDKKVMNEDGFVGTANELVSCDDRYRAVISSLLGRIAVVEDIDYATVTAKKYGYKFRIVTLDGQVINAGGSFTGGSAVHSTGVLTRKNDINIIKKEISSLEIKKSELEKQSETVLAQAQKLKLEIEDVRHHQQQINEDRISFRSEIKSLDMFLSQDTDTKQKLDENIARLKTRITENNAKAAASRKKLDEITRKLQAAQTKIESQQNIIDSITLKRSQLTEKMSELKIKRMEVLKDTQSIEKEIESSSDSVTDISRSAKQLKIQIEDCKKSISEKKAAIEENQKLYDKNQSDISGFHEQVKLLAQQHDKQEAMTTQLRNDSKQISDEKERLSRELSRIDERKMAAQRDFDTMISQLWDNYEMTRSEAESTASKLDNVLTAQKQLNEIKSKIKALGHVNVAAIEEYKEVSERYSFLSQQLSDVEISKKELLKLISDLTSDMQTLFAESFKQINENFKEIFADLFGGGKADLVLTDPDNLLESGIEIVVAPPGKVIKNLIALSGGEQAFVAIAIYFAILKIKPAPFCILDEIDAALDEVNVRKYAMYLKNFVNTTQFILVTHRRGTMELANVLYGVTMQFNGVSKLLKMNQADIPDEMQ